MLERLKSWSETINSLAPIRALIWSLALGIAIVTTGWANINNRIAGHDREILQIHTDIRDINEDRKTQLAEWRSWRESTSKQLSRIEGLQEALIDQIKEKH